MNNLEWMEFAQRKPLPFPASRSWDSMSNPDHLLDERNKDGNYRCCECVCPATSFLQQEQYLLYPYVSFFLISNFHLLI